MTMPNLSNGWTTTLSASLDDSATTVTVTSATGIPDRPFQAVILAEGSNTNEIITVTDLSTLTLTLTRATEKIADGTQVASSHASGATISHVLTAGSLADLFASGGGLVDPMTSTGDLIYESGGADLALGRGPYASASSTYGGGFVAARAFDGDDATAWIADSGPQTGQWLKINLGSPLAIASFHLLSDSDTGYHNRQFRSYEIQSSSNNTDWTTRHTGAGGWAPDSGTVPLDTPATAQYWRFYSTQELTGWEGELFTFSLFAAVVPARLPIGATGDILTVVNGVPAWVAP